MKKWVIISMLSLISTFSVFGQSDKKTGYLQKSKNQKTAAFVLLGLGAALDIGGIIATTSNANKEVDHIFSTQQNNSVSHGGEYVLYIAGTACLAGSLTLFILSKANKKKALALGVDNQQFHQLKNGSFFAVNYPAITMKIKLGK